jgi:hypothetical protein
MQLQIKTSHASLIKRTMRKKKKNEKKEGIFNL